MKLREFKRGWHKGTGGYDGIDSWGYTLGTVAKGLALWVLIAAAVVAAVAFILGIQVMLGSS